MEQFKMHIVIFFFLKLYSTNKIKLLDLLVIILKNIKFLVDTFFTEIKIKFKSNRTSGGIITYIEPEKFLSYKKRI